ncbi:MAG: ExeA family protein [Planctomycetota bacterium]
MYEKTYQLKTRPFSAAPNILQYHPTDAAETSLRSCRSAIERQAGPAVIFGGPGTGKTLLLDLLADGYSGHFQVVTIPCARTDTRKDLLQNILFQIGQTYRELSESELRLELADYLRPGPHCPNGLLCLVDDAHCLAEELMDELRLISGIMRGGQIRCQLVLTGNQRLEEMLGSLRQESLNQKISARNYLGALSQTETAEYIRAHLRRAGGGNREFFSEEALRQIHKLSQGVPRLVNQLCDAALQRCVRTGASSVTPAICVECWTELQRLPVDGIELNPSGQFSSRASEETSPASTMQLRQDRNSGVEFGLLDDEGSSRIENRHSLREFELQQEAPETYNRQTGAEKPQSKRSAPIVGTSGQDQPKRRLILTHLEDDACEGRVTGKSISGQANSSETNAPVVPASQMSTGSTGAAKTPAMRGSIKQTACDVDPDCPDAIEQERTPKRLISPSPNPFEEFFETEEVVTEAFVRGTIAHNQQASQLTRAILDEYGVDDLEIEVIRTWNSAPDIQASVAGETVGSEATVPFPTSGTKSEPDRQVSETVDTLQIQATSRVDDRDMLVTSRVNQIPAPPVGKQEHEEFDGPVSTGRAFRMDYKQLFTRLRNSMAPGTTEPTRQG